MNLSEHISKIIRMRPGNNGWTRALKVMGIPVWVRTVPWEESESSRYGLKSMEYIHPLTPKISEKYKISRRIIFYMLFFSNAAIFLLPIINIDPFCNSTFILLLLVAMIFIMHEMDKRHTSHSLPMLIKNKSNEVAVLPLTAKDLVFSERYRMEMISQSSSNFKMLFIVVILFGLSWRTCDHFGLSRSNGIQFSFVAISMAYLFKEYYRGFSLIFSTMNISNLLRKKAAVARLDIPFEVSVRLSAFPILILTIAIFYFWVKIIQKDHSLVYSLTLFLGIIILSKSPFTIIGNKFTLYEYKKRMRDLQDVLEQRE